MIKKDLQRNARSRVCVSWFVGAALTGLLAGCKPNYHQLRVEGQKAVIDGSYGSGRHFFADARRIKPRATDNLHDLGVCCVMVAKEKFKQRNYAAAMRELDNAVFYYTAAIDADPGHQACIEGKSIALKLKGQFDEALKNNEWAAEFVGPSARQYVLLARELDERGHLEDAMLRYRQAVAMEPKNVEARIAFADFLIRVDSSDAALQQLHIANRLNPKDAWVADKLMAYGEAPRLASQSPRQP